MTILPMLASPTSGASNRTPVVFEDLIRSGDWVADVKMDGVRGLIHWNPEGQLLITNRNGVDITTRYPEIASAASTALAGQPQMLLDGEIIARSGSFEDTLRRDQQVRKAAIKVLSEEIPCTFVAFDIPEFRTPWHERRGKLARLVSGGIWEGPHLQATMVSSDADFLERTRELGMEGVVAKHVRSRYEFGKRSKQWLKFRNRYKVSCLVAGYTPGTGSRTDFGAMVLAMLDGDGNPVDVGRVGTGFTERQIPELKTALDSGRLLVVEIETTNQTKGGQLRFPVFRGVRTDVAPLDCSIEQLKYLPTC